MNEQTVYDEVVMAQDHERGPGWFLKVSYVVITLFCIYYLYTYWDWKSEYDVQQEKIQMQLSK